eukprot:3628473-Prymnesium_polylepis.1
MLGMREWRRPRRCGRSERHSQEHAAGGSESPRRRPEGRGKCAYVQGGQKKRGGRGGVQRASGRVRSGMWMSAVRFEAGTWTQWRTLVVVAA